MKRHATGTDGLFVPRTVAEAFSLGGPANSRNRIPPLAQSRGHFRDSNREARSLIETRGLRRTFKGRGGIVEAVAGVDLTVNKGEIFGFLGPNGAGKTTTL